MSTEGARLASRWKQFSLRMLLVLLTLASLVLGFIAHQRQQIKHRQALVQHFIELGAEVVYNTDSSTFRRQDQSWVESPGPVWLSRLLGGDYRQTLRAINFDNRFFSFLSAPSDFEKSAIRGIESTLFRDARAGADDAVLAQLAEFRELRILDLAHTEITDTGLAHLPAWPLLEDLNLEDTALSDEGLKHFAGRKHLRAVNLSKTKITGAGLQHFRDYQSIEILTLDDTGVDEAGLKHLKGIDFDVLNLRRTKLPLDDEVRTRIRELIPKTMINFE